MKWWSRAAVASFACALVAAGVSVPAQAEPKPENPKGKTFTTRSATCEWLHPVSEAEKFSTLSVKFILIDGEAYAIQKFTIRGKRPGKNTEIAYGVADVKGSAWTFENDVSVVGQGILDRRGRANEKVKHLIVGDTIAFGLYSGPDDPQWWDPTTWAPNLCTTTMDIPYAPSS